MKSPTQEECKKFMFPYGEGEIGVEIPDRNSPKILRVAEPDALSNETEGLLEAIKNPIGCEPLTSLLRPESEVVFIISDITRPVPNHKIIPCLLDELSRIPVPIKNVSVVVATGMHRANTEVELRSMLGGEVYDKVRIINHNAFRSDNMTGFGETSYGTPLVINEVVAGADAIIATGYIEPHEFAGFTGGRKSILPGVSGIESIRWNHRLEMLDHPKAKIGTLRGNPIHEDMVEAAKKVGLDFIVNVMLNSRKKIVDVFSGDFFDAHIEGVECYRRFAAPDFVERAEVVVASSGYPLDGDLYQSIKSVIAADPFVKDESFIILLTESRNGFGPGAFGEWMKTITSIDEVEPRIREEGFSPEIDHCYLLAKILRRSKLIVVSSNSILSSIQFSDRLLTSDSPEEALKIAFADVSGDAEVIGLPYAPRIVAREHQ
jgi:nickel-dependent lactate racemase